MINNGWDLNNLDYGFGERGNYNGFKAKWIPVTQEADLALTTEYTIRPSNFNTKVCGNLQNFWGYSYQDPKEGNRGMDNKVGFIKYEFQGILSDILESKSLVFES